MIFRDIRNIDDKFYGIEYETTWNLGWSNVLDISQIFLDDIRGDVQLLQYIDFDGGSNIGYVPDILEKNSEFRREHRGLSLAGTSKVMGFPIRITLYNQLKNVSVQVMKVSDELVEQFDNHPNTLDIYMNSLELRGYMRSTIKESIDIVHNALSDKNKIDAYRDLCNSLNITPQIR